MLLGSAARCTLALATDIAVDDRHYAVVARVRWSGLLHGFVRYTATLTLQVLLKRCLGVDSGVERMVEQEIARVSRGGR